MRFGLVVLVDKINSKLISVVVPCFNSGKTIKRTIKSLKKQTWNQKEIIVVNDGSNDKETLDIINSLEGVLIINQENLDYLLQEMLELLQQEVVFFSSLIQMIGLKMILWSLCLII